MASEPICIFEDEECGALGPLVATRPVYALRLGLGTLRERIEAVFGPAPVALHCRPELVPALVEDNPGTDMNAVAFDRCLFVNGRVVASEGLLRSVAGNEDRVYRAAGGVVAGRVSGERLERVRGHLGQPLGDAAWDGLPVGEVEARFIRYPWELVAANPGEIAWDFERLLPLLAPGVSPPNDVRCVNPDAVHVAEGCRLDPGVVLDASAGPIVLGPGVTVGGNAVIRGPAAVGEGSLIHPLTSLQGTSAGPVCKLGGEIRDCIVQGYSNKQHGGFLGHAYLGEWVNLGAGTNNSDLKNNYSSVRVRISGEHVDSGELLVGCFIGDHSKSAIGSRFNTGSVFGICCLLHAQGFLPKYVPSFTWLGTTGPVKYSLKKALETVRVVMARRGVKLTPAREALLRSVYEKTSEERKGFGALAP